MLDRKSGGFISANPPAPTRASAQGVWDGNQQIVAQVQNAWPLPPNVIQRSLRFDETAYFTRTPTSTGDRRTYVWSGWVKRTVLGATNYALFGARPYATSTPFTFLRFVSDAITFTDDGGASVSTAALYRDPSAWYHIVLAVDTTNGTPANTVRIYVNGVAATLSSPTYPSTNAQTTINSTNLNTLGVVTSGASSYVNQFPGYMAEVNLIDGYPTGYNQTSFAALNVATLFGETDAQTGVWVPKRYTGTYGTNGFRLPFTNNSTTTALGYDASGNGNNWTPNNFSVTAGTGNDSLLDVPSLYGTDTGLGGEVRGNYCTWNPLYANTTGVATLSNGNLDFNCPNTFTGTGTMAVTTGKWYWEITPTTNALLIGIKQAGITDRYGNTIYYGGASITNGGIYVNGNPGANFSNWTVGDVIGVAPDMDAGLVYFYKNGVLQGSVTLSSASITAAVPAVGAGAGLSFAGSANFGQRPFAYTAPTGFKALCTTNFVAPAIGQTAANQADNHFAAVTYQGNGSTQNVVTDFAPDLVWIKNRTTNYSHLLYDTIRGPSTGSTSKALFTNGNDGEGVINDNSTYGYLSAFNSNGFTVNAGSYVGSGGYANTSGQNYVAWCWNAGGATVTNNAGTISAQVRANPRAGFSIISYTGNGSSNQNVGHGLGVPPKLFIIKDRDAAVNWFIYTTAIDGSLDYLNFNTGAKGDSTNSVPNSDVLYMSGASINAPGNKYICYAFAEVPGFSAIGSYTGNGSADGPFVHLGFRPAFVLQKPSSVAFGWQIFDVKRNDANPTKTVLQPNLSNAESNWTNGVDFLSNGFKIRQSEAELNQSSQTYIYAAFAENPFRLSSAR